jgi:nitrite reductase (NADH) small subunit
MATRTLDAVRPVVPATEQRWVRVCPIDRILVDAGVAALVDGVQVAVFRLRSGRLYAIDNRDPCSGANVLARGIIGDVAGAPYVASPLHKERFDLATGRCLDVDGCRVGTHDVALDTDGTVTVRRVDHTR